ncbi:uncharacterized protein PgNI_03296 [Pyricularia grisea]|uniref:Uncharacterized protein n=1 Tax=Pyricularia grisea TaxID=148305 RepID=A0A6P8B979_PYRGI|nr:uncharacterized protein PgNI_03296 [Pyricularia grisea]TLD12395.1 hypothetical protein PgNI_03296 [Pyricularia grisea]
MPCANQHPSSDRPSPRACSMHLRPIQTGFLEIGDGHSKYTALLGSMVDCDLRARASLVTGSQRFFFSLLMKDKKKSSRRGFRGSPVFYAKH